MRVGQRIFLTAIGNSKQTNGIKEHMKNKSTTTETARKGPHATPLGSYLSITAGAGAASLLGANGAVVFYNGAAVTNNTYGDQLWWDTASMTAGIYRNQSVPDLFQIINVRVNYAYTFKPGGSLLDTFFGVTASGGTSVNKLAAGETIDSSTYFSGNAWTYMKSPGSPWATGVDGTTGYIPFKFSKNVAPADMYYGWADITFNAVSGSIVLNNFAYNDTPNASITTGGGGDVSPVPEVTSSFTLLGLITGGLMMRRRRGNQAAVAVAS